MSLERSEENVLLTLRVRTSITRSVMPTLFFPNALSHLALSPKSRRRHPLRNSFATPHITFRVITAIPIAGHVAIALPGIAKKSTALIRRECKQQQSFRQYARLSRFRFFQEGAKVVVNAFVQGRQPFEQRTQEMVQVPWNGLPRSLQASSARLEQQQHGRAEAMRAASGFEMLGQAIELEHLELQH